MDFPSLTMCESGEEDMSQVYRRVYEAMLMNINFNQDFPIFLISIDK